MGNHLGIPFQYLQIRIFLNGQQVQFNIFRFLLTTFEVIANTVSSQQHLLSKKYNTLWEAQEDQVKVHWEHDLKESITNLEWNRINRFNQTFSTNVGVRVNRYK